MPELPEVEITARRLDAALRGARIESALAPGINALKTFDPPLAALEGERIAAVRRHGKHLIVESTGELALLIHLMSAGRLQLYDRRAGPRDRTSRLLVRIADGRELRVTLGNRTWRVRGLDKVTSFDALKENTTIEKIGIYRNAKPNAMQVMTKNERR